MPEQTHLPNQTIDPGVFYDDQEQVCRAPPGDNTFRAAQLGMGTATSSSSPSSGSSSSAGGKTTAAPPAGGGGASKPDLDHILKNYQVNEDKMTEWGPTGFSWYTGKKTMTKTEAELLDQLQFKKGLMGLKGFKDIKESAYAVSGERFKKNDEAGKPGAEDGHQDAFRHMYWNVMMTKKFGPEFAEAFGTAHEGVPGNPAAREAMDLYNNELGRKIVAENPDASDKELQELVMKAITDGKAIVIDKKGDIQFSDQVKVGETGAAKRGTLPGKQDPPEWSSSR